MAWHPFRNLGLKAAALGLGALLWFTITGEQVERKVPRVPIIYRNLSASLEITDQPDSVDVSVRGNYADITRIGDMAITADLAGAVPGANVLPLRVDQVNVPLGVQVTQIDPGTVTVYVEKSGMADVPVRPTIEGQPALGFAVSQQRVEPNMVRVVGPESRLKPTTTAVTERISIEGLTDTVTQVVSVGVADAQLRLARPQTVRVTLVITPVPTELRAPDRPLELRGLGRGRTAEAGVQVVVVHLRASGRAAQRFDATSVQPWLDLADRGPGRYNLPVRVDLPDEFELVSVTPSTVTVRVR